MQRDRGGPKAQHRYGGHSMADAGYIRWTRDEAMVPTFPEILGTSTLQKLRADCS